MDGGHTISWRTASRFRGRVQLTTDGHRAYLEAVEDAFGGDMDFAIAEDLWRSNELRSAIAPRVHRLRHENRHRQSRSGARQYLFRGAPEPDDADGDAAVYPAHQRLFKEDREPCGGGRAALHLLQFRANPQNSEDHARDGRWHLRPRLELSGDRISGLVVA